MIEGGLIEGVVVKSLRVVPDERGWLMEIIRRDDPFFSGFGQTYLTAIYPGVVKGWHWHRRQTDHFCVVRGMAKVVLYDRRDGSPTQGQINEFFIGEKNPSVVVIPCGVLHGMKGIGPEPALLLNLTTEPYDHSAPDEYRVAPHGGDIPYDWTQEDG
jgi:dTDP-4-dehydrorhamnose 3,5-epimerase